MKPETRIEVPDVSAELPSSLRFPIRIGFDLTEGMADLLIDQLRELYDRFASEPIPEALEALLAEWKIGNL